LLLLVPSASTIVVAPPGQVAAESRRRRPVGLPASLCGLHFGSQHRITLRGRGQIVPGSHVGGHHYRPFNGEIVAAVALRPGGWSEEYKCGREEGVDEKVADFFFFYLPSGTSGVLMHEHRRWKKTFFLQVGPCILTSAFFFGKILDRRIAVFLGE